MMITPIISTKVARRMKTSSVSYADASHEKLIQAQVTAKTPIAKPRRAVPVLPSSK